RMLVGGGGEGGCEEEESECDLWFQWGLVSVFDRASTGAKALFYGQLFAALKGRSSTLVDRLAKGRSSTLSIAWENQLSTVAPCVRGDTQVALRQILRSA
ncbi:MAG: hypothetical protein WCB05_13250, partial [Candidatus Sulfotelmatobacter sp.]